MKYSFFAAMILALVSGVHGHPELIKSSAADAPKPLMQEGSWEHLIPKPLQLTPGNGGFALVAGIQVSGTNHPAVNQLVSQVSEWMAGLNKLPITATPGKGVVAGKGKVLLLLTDTLQLGTEGYDLNIQNEGIRLLAKTPAGLFYGVQTLLQCLPPAVYQRSIYKGPVKIAAVRIRDEPRYSYRGLHLDCGRHFFDVAFIKKYIDLMAAHKFNTFHWHLTEDQGWRIEIKKYPRLTSVGAWRRETVVGHASTEPVSYDGTPHGGFYTQDEIKGVVKYAADRFITIVPEIEMPGHARAAIAAYPELSCTDQPMDVASTWGVFDDVFCPEETTFDFLEDVLTEVIALFPGKYIHIGGDECPKVSWENSEFCQQIMRARGLKDEHELQSYFIQRIEKFLNSKGKILIGWDEILEGGLAPNAVVMSWRGIDGGIAAARQKHQVIMTPTTAVYLDYYQGEPGREPLGIGGYLPIEKVYAYEPDPVELTAEEQGYILGVQANVWTEYMKTSSHVEYMTWPRACAVAELGWTKDKRKDFPDFQRRLIGHLPRLQAMKVNYGKAFLDPVIRPVSGWDQPGYILFEPAPAGIEYRFTTDASMVSARSSNAAWNPSTPGKVLVQAQPFKGGSALGRSVAQWVAYHWGNATGVKASATLNPELTAKLKDGLIGKETDLKKWSAGKNWASLGNEAFTFEYQFASPIEAKSFSFAALNQPTNGLGLPAQVKVMVSKDGINFTDTPTVPAPRPVANHTPVMQYHLALPPGSIKALKVVLDAPASQNAKGKPFNMAIDEFIVH
jgi:hexosaminidase